MLADVGFFCLLMCLVLSTYGTFAALVAGWTKHGQLFQSAKLAATASALLCVMGSIILWVLLFQRDYSVGYVYRNSSNDLPVFYTFAAFWSALEGSHLLWTLFLSIFACIAHWSYARHNEPLFPYVSAALQSILSWMFYLAVTYSNPFEPMLPVPTNGIGMNALLQNPYMAFHPPALFIGYTGLALPFAYGIAALAYGDIPGGWRETVRRWALWAWVFLTIGVFLGGRWAYVELGWAGYWAWDPVENSSFVPWLFSTALLHALLVLEKLGQLKRLSIVLGILAFFFSYFGTFITRSGIISSVHSFAQSPIGPNYLIYLGLLSGISIVLYIWRAPGILPPDAGKVWGFSKESALVVTQFLVLTFALIIFIGTIYPILSEAFTGSRFNIQAPYFNAFAPYIGFGFIFMIAIGNLMRYQGSPMVGGKYFLILSAILGIIPTILFCYAGDVFRTKGLALGMQVVGVWLSFWAFLCLAEDFSIRLKDLKYNWRLLLQRNLSYVGATVAHVGVLIAVLGFLGNYRGLEKLVTLNTGEHVEFMGYQLTFHGMGIREEENVTLFGAELDIKKDGHPLGTVFPARAKYPTSGDLFHEIGLFSRFWNDLYVVLSDFDRETGSRATLQIHLNPTVRIVWISAFFFVIGGLLCLFDPYRGTRRLRGAKCN